MTPGAWLIYREEVEALDRALEKLSPRERAVLDLINRDQLDYGRAGGSGPLLRPDAEGMVSDPETAQGFDYRTAAGRGVKPMSDQDAEQGGGDRASEGHAQPTPLLRTSGRRVLNQSWARLILLASSLSPNRRNQEHLAAEETTMRHSESPLTDSSFSWGPLSRRQASEQLGPGSTSCE